MVSTGSDRPEGVADVDKICRRQHHHYQPRPPSEHSAAFRSSNYQANSKNPRQIPEQTRFRPAGGEGETARGETLTDSIYQVETATFPKHKKQQNEIFGTQRENAPVEIKTC